MIETSSVLSRKSSVICGNLQQCSENVRKCSSGLWNAVCVIFLVKLRWPKKKSLYDTLEQFWEISGNLRKVVRNGRKISKTSSLVCLCIIDRILHARLWIWFSSSHVQLDQHLTRSLRSLSRYRVKLEDKIHIHAQACNILYLCHNHIGGNCNCYDYISNSSWKTFEKTNLWIFFF